jgi:hypothetical protein
MNFNQKIVSLDLGCAVRFLILLDLSCSRFYFCRLLFSWYRILVVCELGSWCGFSLSTDFLVRAVHRHGRRIHRRFGFCHRNHLRALICSAPKCFSFARSPVPGPSAPSGLCSHKHRSVICQFSRRASERRSGLIFHQQVQCCPRTVRPARICLFQLSCAFAWCGSWPSSHLTAKVFCQPAPLGLSLPCFGFAPVWSSFFVACARSLLVVFVPTARRKCARQCGFLVVIFRVGFSLARAPKRARGTSPASVFR